MTYEQKLQAAVVRGSELMIKHGLSDWLVKIQSKRTVLADASTFNRTIRYSKHFIRVATQEQFDGVTLHEIAHALVGRGHGHDSVFVNKCIEISPNSDYARRSVEISIFKYKLECKECGASGGCNRIRNSLCGRCHRNGRAVKLIVTPVDDQVIAWA